MDIHTIPIKLRISINEDHAVLDSIIREYSKKMGMSMTTFITEVLLNVLLKDRTVGVFRDAEVKLNFENKSIGQFCNIDNKGPITANDNQSNNGMNEYGSSALEGSIVDMDDEF